MYTAVAAWGSMSGGRDCFMRVVQKRCECRLSVMHCQKGHFHDANALLEKYRSLAFICLAGSK